MEDPALNRRIEETRELHTRWGQFHDFFNMALKGQKPTPEAELKFLELKTRIAMLHDGFMQSLKHDQKVGQQVLTLLATCILLRRVPSMSGAEVQKLELEWNEAYMLMNETIAGLEEERERLANVNERAYKLKQARQRLILNTHNLFMSGQFRFLFFVIVIPIFVLFGIPYFHIYDYNRIPDTFPKVAPVYFKATGLYRKFINHNYPYRKLIEAGPETVTAAAHTSVGSQSGAGDILVSQLVNLGFPANGPDLATAKEMISHQLEFKAEKRQMNQSKRQMQAYYILFPDIETAKQFVELRRKGINDYDEDIKIKMKALVNVCMKSNLVAIFVSEEDGLRIQYPKEKFGFDDSQMNL